MMEEYGFRSIGEEGAWFVSGAALRSQLQFEQGAMTRIDLGPGAGRQPWNQADGSVEAL